MQMKTFSSAKQGVIACICFIYVSIKFVTMIKMDNLLAEVGVVNWCAIVYH